VVLADLSAGGTPATTPKQLVAGPTGVYVLDPYSNTLALIDQPGKEPTPLLAKGWTVARQKVSELVGVTWRGDTLVVLDRQRAYTLDGPNGTWRAAPLAAAGIGLGVHPVASFEGNLYVLDNAARQLFKFPQGAYGKPPQPWVRLLTDRADLGGVLDIAIDGRVYALTGSGQILSFFRGGLERTIKPEAMPAVQGPAALASPPDSTYLYLAESNGRILKLTKEGTLIRQYRLPEGSTDLAGLTDLAVNETTGTIYAVAGNRIMLLRLPDEERSTTRQQQPT
jgi:hypothetical protein